LANLPSKEELVWKLLYLLKFPLQSLTWTLDQIAKKQS
jgi:ribosomal protein L10